MSKPPLSKKLGALLALPEGCGWQRTPTSGPGKAAKDFCKKRQNKVFHPEVCSELVRAPGKVSLGPPA